jgi:hypothetical protein
MKDEMDDKTYGCERHFSHLSIRRSSPSLLATTASKSTLSQPWSERPINASAGTSASTDLIDHQPGSSGPHPISAAGQRFEKDSNILLSASYRSKAARRMQLAMEPDKLFGWHSVG